MRQSLKNTKEKMYDMLQTIVNRIAQGQGHQCLQNTRMDMTKPKKERHYNSLKYSLM